MSTDSKPLSIEDVFENEYRKIDLMKIDQQLEQDYRFDTYAGIKQNYMEFCGQEADIESVTDLIEEVAGIHEEIKKRIGSFKVEDFGVDGFKDPYEDLVPRPKKYQDWEEVFHDMIVFHAVRPWAEIAFNVNHLMQKEREKKAEAQKVMEVIAGGKQ